MSTNFYLKEKSYFYTYNCELSVVSFVMLMKIFDLSLNIANIEFNKYVVHFRGFCYKISEKKMQRFLESYNFTREITLIYYFNYIIHIM